MRRSGFSGLGPRVQHVPDVGQRVAERRDLPVEHRRDASLEGRDAVAEPVVAVHDARRALLRSPRRELVVQLVDDRQLPGLGRVPLRVPPLELARDVPLFARDVADADVVGVDRMHVGEHVDEGLSRRPPLLARVARPSPTVW